MAKVGDYINNNSECFNQLAKAGAIPASVVNKVKIYEHFKMLDSPSRMQKYEDTAAAMKVNSVTVMRAVKDMEKNI